MPDAIFEHPRLTTIYDSLDPDRSDLAFYVAMATDLGAFRVLDVGCGTGVFALLLAARGLCVTGLDPAKDSLRVAQQKHGAEKVRWLLGDSTELPPMQVDLATMTGNVAQAIVDPAAWVATVRSVRNALQPSGHFVFETRDPAFRAWSEWNRNDSLTVTDIPDVGTVESWVEVTEIFGPLVSFRWTYCFQSDGVVLTSDSTLRFRELHEVEETLTENGFTVRGVHDAPDRPGREFIFDAERTAG